MRSKSYVVALVAALTIATVYAQDASAFNRRGQACTSSYAAPAYYAPSYQPYASSGYASPGAGYTSSYPSSGYGGYGSGYSAGSGSGYTNSYPGYRGFRSGYGAFGR